MHHGTGRWRLALVAAEVVLATVLGLVVNLASSSLPPWLGWLAVGYRSWWLLGGAIVATVVLLAFTSRGEDAGHRIDGVVADPTTGLTRPDGPALAREAETRRTMRAEILGLSPAQVRVSFDVGISAPTTHIPDPTPGNLLVVIGPLGSGKSDLADVWLLEQVAIFNSSLLAPWPVWVKADRIDSSLEQKILQTVPSAALREHGARIVVDGLDERTLGAPGLLEEARLLTAKWPKVSIVVTSRDSFGLPNERVIIAEPWTDEAARALIHAVARADNPNLTDGWWHGWPTSLRESIRRPLFALLAAKQVGRQSVPKTTAELLSLTAMDALHRTNSIDSEAFPLLTEIATATTNAGKPVSIDSVGGLRKIQSLRNTRLLVVGDDYLVGFGLAIIEQWFAAQALLEEKVIGTTYTGDVSSFGRWRYALAMAVSVGSSEQSARIMACLARWNPGAAAWVLKESTTSGIGSDHSNEEPLPNWLSVGLAIKNATDAWRAGLKQVGDLALPLDTKNHDSAEPITVGIRVLGRRRILQSYAWSSEISGPVVELPADFRMFGPMAGHPPWRTTKGGTPTPGSSWPWRWTFDMMREQLRRVLPRRLHEYVPSAGVVAREHRWSIIATLAGNASTRRPIQRSKVVASIRTRLKSVGDLHNVREIHVGRHVFSVQELQALQGSLEEDVQEWIQPPWPEPNRRPNGPSRWVWQLYSTDGLLEATRDIYNGALTAYREIADGLFATFGAALGYRSLMPAILKGQLWVNEIATNEYDPPWLTYEIWPGNRQDVEIRVSSDWSSDLGVEGVYLAHMRTHLAANAEAEVFGHIISHHEALDIFVSRPATTRALKWLWTDLSSLGWLSGVPPEL